MTVGPVYAALDAESNEVTFVKKISSAIFYSLTSFMITVVNKTVLTSWHFPSFMVLSLGQMLTTVIVLYCGKASHMISFPDLSYDIPQKLHPLPIIHLGNMIFGLGGTQALSLPMFTAIRRFTILITMLLEIKVLGVYPSKWVQISVFSMIVGALIAAADDLAFNLEGYCYVMISNLLTAANGVYVKQNLETLDMGKYGLMFYNSLIMIVPAIFLSWIFGDLQAAYAYPHWNQPLFLIQFISSCIMGLMLSYSIILCTHYNSALTTTIVGCLKNICVTYLGMFIGGDYQFSWLNWIGINVSVIGSLLYSYVTFGRKEPNKVVNKAERV